VAVEAVVVIEMAEFNVDEILAIYSFDIACRRMRNTATGDEMKFFVIMVCRCNL